MQNSAVLAEELTSSKEIYNEIIERILAICEEDIDTAEIHSWILGGSSSLSMCFVGDNCPNKYRNAVVNIIKEVESNYNF